MATHDGVHTYTTPAYDLDARNAEIAGIKAVLEAEHGPGVYTARRIVPDGESVQDLVAAEFSNTIHWWWRTV